MSDEIIFGNNEDSYDVLKGCRCGSGSLLPEVTSADNGKVLTVIDGGWGAGEASLQIVPVTPLSDSVYEMSDIMAYYGGAWTNLISLYQTPSPSENTFKINDIPSGFFVAYLEDVSSYITIGLGVNIINYEANDNTPEAYGNGAYCLTGNGTAIVFESDGNAFAFITNDEGKFIPGIK